MQFECIHYKDLSKEQLYAFLRLRQEVFILEQTCFYLDADGWDQQAHHLFRYSDGQYKAYARLLPAGVAYENYPSFGRVLVPEQYRNSGLGIALVNECIKQCKLLYNDQPIKISAQLYLQEFYAAFGFEKVGEVYLDAGIEHIGMLRKNK